MISKAQLFTLSIFLIAGCETQKPKEYGSLSGNVFWKYNNYVGNRPDANSKVEIYNLNDTSIKYDTKVDLRGDFSLDSVEAGKYLMVVRSENTNDSYRYLLFNMLLYRRKIGKIDPQFDTTILNEKMPHYFYLDSLVNSTRGSEDRNSWKIEAKWRDSLEFFSRRTIHDLPESKISWSRYALIGKLHFEEIEIKPKLKEKVVVDFGITYR